MVKNNKVASKNSYSNNRTINKKLKIAKVKDFKAIIALFNSETYKNKLTLLQIIFLKKEF